LQAPAIYLALWALDVERKLTRRVSVGPEKYRSVAASADGLPVWPFPSFAPAAAPHICHFAFLPWHG